MRIQPVASLIAALLLAAACHPRPDVAAAPDATDLAQLRAATQPFTLLDSAVAAGYTRNVTACLVHEHHGAMGYHHTNPPLMDATVDPTRPEILLYERMPSGAYQLNGVEFIVPYRSWPRDSIAPRALGQAMQHEDNLNFWYLHVWAFRPNPDGLFANFHPDVRCPPEQSRVFRPSEG